MYNWCFDENDVFFLPEKIVFDDVPFGFVALRFPALVGLFAFLSLFGAVAVLRKGVDI